MKETWSLGPGETIELKMRFTDHIGNYMFHCHILEHEDDGMMTQFEVIAPAPLLGIQSGSSGAVVKFQAVQGKTYRLERKTDLRSASWDDLGDVTAGSSGPMNVADSNAASLSEAYYRVREMP